MTKRTALVTGASAGIGASIAVRLASLGITTYAAARRTDRMEHLKAHGIHVLPLDLTDDASIATCVAAITEESGGIDILINNAGYGSYGSIEEVSLEDARRQLEVNLFGLAALTRRLIPRMRTQRSGRIVNISSIGGVFASPYGGWYHVTKFALEAFSSALRQELSPFGVHVVVIRPGAIKSEWASIAAESLKRVSGGGPYAPAAQKLHDLFTSDKLDKMAGEPSVIADAVEKAVMSKCPHSIYTAPFLARIMVLISRLAGCDFMRDKLNRAFLGLPKKM